MKVAILSLLCFTFWAARAQVDTASGHQPDTNTRLREAVIVEKGRENTTESATLAEAGERKIQGPGNPQLLSSTQNLNLQPGITAFDGAPGTAKFSFRGMGARTQYTTSRSLLYFGQIPLTSLQGFSSFEDISPVWIGSRHFSATTPRHPRALGGVLKFEPKGVSVYPRNHMVQTRFRAGSFGLLQSHSLVSLDFDSLALTAGYENTRQQGWRQNNQTQRQSIFLNFSRKLNSDHDLRFLVLGIQNRVEIPSSLARNDFEDNPRQGADNWANTEGYKEYDRLLTGLTFSKSNVSDFNYEVTAFYRYLDNFEPRPFNILQEKRHTGGLRYQLEADLPDWGTTAFSLSSYGEYQIGNERAATFENRYDSATATYNNVGASLNTNDILGQRFNSGLFLDTRLNDDSATWQVRGGADVFYQYNQVQGSRVLSYEVPLQLAPLLRVDYYRTPAGYSLNPYLKIYRSYSIPSLEENLDPDGSLNRGLKPELGWTGELGFDFRVMPDRKWKANLNYYYTEVKNLIVPRVTGPDQVIATNSGRSRHTGLEWEVFNKSYVDADKNWYPHFVLSGYYGRFAYISFSDTTGSYGGNELPGFPEWQVNASFELKYDNQKFPAGPKYGNNFRFTWGVMGRVTSGYFVNDANTVATNPYFLLQSWVKAERTLGENFVASLQLGLRNITDAGYAAMTVVNNQSFGNSAPRFFYPGEPLNWYGGFSVSYKFGQRDDYF